MREFHFCCVGDCELPAVELDAERMQKWKDNTPNPWNDAMKRRRKRKEDR